jgi:hypothetical protein
MDKKPAQYGILSAEVSPLAVKLAEQRRRVQAIQLATRQGVDWRRLRCDNPQKQFTLESDYGIN